MQLQFSTVLGDHTQEGSAALFWALPFESFCNQSQGRFLSAAFLKQAMKWFLEVFDPPRDFKALIQNWSLGEATNLANSSMLMDPSPEKS